jgi:hypothetical protein
MFVIMRNTVLGKTIANMVTNGKQHFGERGLPVKIENNNLGKIIP